MTRTLVYELYPLTWSGFRGMSAFLPQISELTVDYVRVAPPYPSLRLDSCHDVIDFKDIDPRYGDMADFYDFVESAHTLGLRVIVDIDLGNTSTYHDWFYENPDYYCWSENDLMDWRNILVGHLKPKTLDWSDYGHPGMKTSIDPGKAWHYDPYREKFYLSLRHEGQATLNWFPDGILNFELVYEFREILDFWTNYGVDGFFLDFPQGINVDINKDELNLDELYSDDLATIVINEVFEGHENQFLMMDLINPHFNKALVDLYAYNTPVDLIADLSIRQQIKDMGIVTDPVVKKAVQDKKTILCLESHDTDRTPAIGVYPQVWKPWAVFRDLDPNAYCMFQGEELGLKNPGLYQLPYEFLLEYDATARARYRLGESLTKISRDSCANNMLPIPLDEYRKQSKNQYSMLNKFTREIQGWHAKF